MCGSGKLKVIKWVRCGGGTISIVDRMMGWFGMWLCT
jgi:hypothetical protein